MAAKEKKALGTGLGVLFGGDDFEEEKASFLPVGKIEPRLQQPRDYFDEEALQTLADSISQYGIIQPITVRRLESGYYQIIAGERRWRAAKLAGLTEVPVSIMEADDRTTAELALVENLQREDLNPIEEARGFKTLIDVYGLTQDEAARSVGRSRPAVANAMRLLNLSPGVLKMVEQKELSAGHARAILPLADSAVQMRAAKEIIEKNLSVRRSELLAAKLSQNSEEEKAPARPGVDYARELSDSLTKLLGRKVTLTEGKKTGKIELEFYGADDREALIEQLRKIKKQ